MFFLCHYSNFNLYTMVIPFKQQFVQPILDGTKIHTIREDKNNRWKAGMTMHMATGVRTKQYNCFKEEMCTSVRRIHLNPHEELVFFLDQYGHAYFIFSQDEIKLLAKNDGFKSVEDFWHWFDKPFTGKLIFWTLYTY